MSRRRYTARHRAVPRTAPVAQPAVPPVEPPDARLWVPVVDPWAPHPLLPPRRLPFLHRIGVRNG